MNIKSVKRNGTVVTEPIAAFNVSAGYVDVFVLGPDGKPEVSDGRPRTTRLHGRIEIEWDMTP